MVIFACMLPTHQESHIFHFQMRWTSKTSSNSPNNIRIALQANFEPSSPPRLHNFQISGKPLPGMNSKTLKTNGTIPMLHYIGHNSEFLYLLIPVACFFYHPSLEYQINSILYVLWSNFEDVNKNIFETRTRTKMTFTCRQPSLHGHLIHFWYLSLPSLKFGPSPGGRHKKRSGQCWTESSV